MKLNIIFMASGYGRRFGSNKLLHRYKGKKIYLYGLEQMSILKEKLKELEMDTRVIVVSAYQEILDKAKELQMTAILNEEAHLGISSSILLGTGFAEADYYMYMPADMPFVNADRVFLLCKMISENPQKSLFGISDEKGTAYSPCIFEHRYREELMSLKGDRGGKQVFSKYPENTCLLEAPEQELRDIDVTDDLIIE